MVRERKEPRIPIMEIFGPTIQGEGFVTGTVSHFLRTGGCGLECVWCDSLFAVLPAEIKKHRTMMTTAEILDKVFALPWAPYITLTGGDPCLHKRLGDIIPAINAKGTRVAVETQGMLFPDWLKQCDVITFSPKGPSSGNIVDPQLIADYLKRLGTHKSARVCIKVVCFGPSDFEYALDVYKLIPECYYDAFYFNAGTPPWETSLDPTHRVLQVVETQTVLAENLLSKAHDTRFNSKTHIGCQQHVLLWPAVEQGV